MAARLQMLVESLETQVSGRTQGLELATEIGNRLAQITDRRELLETAVNLIGERFQLYYTQIYLLDSQGQTLRMLAGTGEVGRELFARAHYLPVGKGSINGMAAVEKTAVVIENTQGDGTFLANPLLPHTRSEMAIPLLVGTQLLGTLNMQSDQLGVLTKKNIVIFNVLASQLAIALQNADLFERTNMAQMATESQAQRLTHDNWDIYLNAIDRRERIAYSYDQFEAKEIDANLADFGVEKNGIQTAVLVNNEGVGQLQIVGHQDREWTADERAMLDLVARQVGQRIENLRLLDETDRYRSEAEHALRRVTREGWDDYQQQNEQTLAHGYRYDGSEVVILEETALEETAVSESLIIGGQKIGSLSVDAEGGVDRETAVLLEQVAAQLSRHIETLRLENRTEAALANAQRRSQEMARLNRIVARVSKTLDLKESLSIVAEELVSALNIGQCSITLLDENQENLVITAAYPNKEKFEGITFPIEGNLLTQKVVETQSYVYVTDAQNDPIMSITQDLFRQMGIRSVVIFPMIIGGELIGTVGLDIYEAGVTFTEDQLRLAETIIGQAATTVQNARLFDQTQSALAEAKQRSEEMATVNRVAQVASKQVDVEPLLQAIYTEIKGLMDVGTFHIMIYNNKTNMEEFPLMYEQGIRTYLNPQPTNPESYSYRVLQSGEPILENLTPEKVKRIRSNVDLFIGKNENTETVSVMYTPLRTGQNVIGVLSVQSYQYDAYNETDLSLLVSIANYVAVALESARLFEQTRARARQERFLREISERVHTAVDAESVLRTAAREINRSLGLETVVYLDAQNGNGTTTPETNGEQADG
jgi:GAF domain-containing protein